MRISVESVAELRFDDGGPVRAASAVDRLGDRWLIAQDDSTHAAWWDGGPASPVRLLPPVDGLDVFDEPSGTKHLKPDLEAACAVSSPDGPGLLLLGSGSSRARMRVVHVDLGSGTPRVRHVDAPLLYAATSRALGVDADELNMEGACLVGESLRWFHRGRPAAGLPTGSVDLDLDHLLSLVRGQGRGLGGGLGGGQDGAIDIAVTDPRSYDLGSVQGVGLAVTDAVSLGEDGRVLVSAAAEDSANPRDDGPVVGAALVILDGDRVRDSETLPELGGRVAKVEGLAVVAHDREAVRVLATVDADDPGTPSLAVTLRVVW